MKRSTDRTLTTHVGSLPRPADLLDVVEAKEQGKPIDAKAHAARLTGAVKEIVRKQVELGIDVIDDGEYGKPSFVSYVNDRLGGFEVDKAAPGAAPGRTRAKPDRFPSSMPVPTCRPASIGGRAKGPSPTAAWRNCRPTSPI